MWHKCQWPCELDFDIEAKKSFLDFVAAGGIVFHKHTLIFFILEWKLIFELLNGS